MQESPGPSLAYGPSPRTSSMARLHRDGTYCIDVCIPRVASWWLPQTVPPRCAASAGLGQELGVSGSTCVWSVRTLVVGPLELVPLPNDAHPPHGRCALLVLELKAQGRDGERTPGLSFRCVLPTRQPLRAS